ncbi:MAG: MFS transporter [Haliscomenobacteraceae bacterium CHB4]|nr:MFS transporter [Haliscomenobacteraceae bacterium CHB4]
MPSGITYICRYSSILKRYCKSFVLLLVANHRAPIALKMAKRKTPDSEPHQPIVPISPPLSALILYAMGQLGWSLASFGVGNLLIYFYMPPEQGQPVFPSFLYQGVVLGVLTLIGILSAAGRVFDGLIDPLIANWSDNKAAPGGKRRWFLLRGALPFALFGALAFYPVASSESGENFAWLALILALYYFFFAFYVIPYNALLAELGHTPEDRLRISTLLSITWALGFVAGNSAYALQGLFEEMGKTPVQAFQYSVALLNGIALIFMLLPALFLNEKRYARQAPGQHSIRQALGAVLGNANFRWFLASFLLYWLALTFVQLGIGFYTTLLLELDKSMAFTFSLVSFAASFVLYFPVNFLSRKWGKKWVMLAAYLLFGLIFSVLVFVKIIPVPKEWLVYALGVAAAFPLATFGILPNAVIGDEVEREERASGRQLAGMFFGVSAFTMKVGISVANLVFPSLLLFGKSSENPLGVQLTAAAALLFCIAGWGAFRRYEEHAPGY